MRLFVALDPPADVGRAVAAAWEPVRTGADGWRWTRPEQDHLTVAFLGEVAEDRLDDLSERLGRAARRSRPLDLVVGGAGAFSRPAAARVLWARVSGDVDPVRRLAAAVVAGARRAGCDVDDRPLRPHLTVARSREVRDARPLLAQVGDDVARWHVEELHLVRSHLGAEGAVHERLRSWPLGRVSPPQVAG